MLVVVAKKDQETIVYECNGFKYGPGSRSDQEEAKAITEKLIIDGYECLTAETVGSQALLGE
jgi:hypothetical protein